MGLQYFLANFPTGVMGTTVFGGTSGTANGPTITIVAPSNYITVTVSAQVNAPLYFLRMLHLTSGVIAASSQTTRRNANVILVLDRSGSMTSHNSCGPLIQDVQNFANQFIDGRDQLGLVTFSTAAEVDYAPTLYFKSGTPTLNSVIANLDCVGATSSEQGLSLGYQQIVSAINQPGALNVIVFFTDGGANAVYAAYPVKTLADISNSRYDSQNYNTPRAYPASPCTTTGTLNGVLTEVSDSLTLTGYTAGVLDVAAAKAYGISGGSGTPAAISSPGCSFDQNGWSGAMDVRADAAYIPATDVDGNSTSGTGYKPPDLYTSGPYTGYIRTDSPRSDSDTRP